MPRDSAARRLRQATGVEVCEVVASDRAWVEKVLIDRWGSTSSPVETS